MVVGGAALLAGALAAGEPGDLHLASASTKSLLAFAYLVVAGSLVAFTAYAWLLQNVPISKVATYAYVNPLVAVVLGWALLSEQLERRHAGRRRAHRRLGGGDRQARVAPRRAASRRRRRPCAHRRRRALHQATRCRRLSFVTQPSTKAATMTPQDVPGPLVTIESLFPWLAAITPAQEPRPIRPQPPEPAPLREAA